MSAPSQVNNPYQNLVNQIATANKLTLKAFKAKTLQNLIFIILNDTYHLLPYDLAVMWDLSKKGNRLLGVSGQSTYSTHSEIINRWKDIISDLKDPKTPRILSKEDFPILQERWAEGKTNPNASVYWLPFIKENETVGLWLEKWDDPQGLKFSEDKTKILQEYLIPGYVEAWKRHRSRVAFQKLRELFNKQTLSYLIPLLLMALLLIRIPLRIVAPCEVVPKDSYIVTAPLNGIIAKMNVKPGQIVKDGEQLYEYDSRVPLQELKISEKQVLMSQMEINRATAANVEDQQGSADLATLNIKLQKAELEREFAYANYKELIGKSPISGVALIDNPDEWQGKPVKLGEKILLIANPDSTKVRIWIPENDNIQMEKDSRVKVYLNTNPEIDYYVKLNFISHEATFTDKHVSSFMAEGDWAQDNPHAKLGVKGSAILYGENVSLFYYIFRKPISSARDFVGI